MASFNGPVMKGVGRIAIATISLVVMVVMLTMGYNDTVTRLEKHGKRDNSAGNQYYRSMSNGAKLTSSSFTISINTTTILHTVDERFLSVGVTMGSLNRTLGQNYNYTSLWTAARGLAPAIYRMGGAEADFTTFNTSVNCTTEMDDDDELKDRYGKLFFHNMTVCAHVWDNINEFARSVGWDVLYHLNALDRNQTNFDPTNALLLMNYTKQRGYPVLWGLGNEPNGFPRKAHVTVNGSQMADAFHTLRKAITRLPDHKNIFLVGPDTSAPKKKGDMLTSTDKYLNDFLQGVGNATNITSFHYYYTSGRTAGLQNMTDPNVANLLIPNILSVQQSVKDYGSAENSKIWITESGVTFGGYPSGLAGTYVTGMLVLDKLGMSASMGVQLVVQQGLIGKTGGVFDANYKPRLPYWLLLYHKKLMGTRVLNISKSISARPKTSHHNKEPFDFSNYVRVYAHCTKTSTRYQPGAVTLMIINMIPIDEVHLQLEEHFKNTTIHAYHFMPLGAQGIISPHGKLNGQRLKMESDLVLPDYAPQVQPPGSTIVLPQQTYGFYVLPDARALACM